MGSVIAACAVAHAMAEVLRLAVTTRHTEEHRFSWLLGLFYPRPDKEDETQTKTECIPQTHLRHIVFVNDGALLCAISSSQAGVRRLILVRAIP